MTLATDKIELAQQIADALQAGIDAGPRVFFGSTRTKSDYCKNLIRPLLEKYDVDTFLKSLSSHDAKSLKEKYSRLMSCFDHAGELLDQGLLLTTVNRYANDLIKELRDTGQGGKQNTTTAKQKEVKPGPRIKHSDEKLQQALDSFEEFNLECKDAKHAWHEVARHHNFVSWIAARQACYRFRQRRNK